MSVMTFTEEQVPTRAEALDILKRLKREVHHVERVTADWAVLFIGALGRPWTAWLGHTPDGELTVTYEQGWSADLGSCAGVSDEYLVPLGEQ